MPRLEAGSADDAYILAIEATGRQDVGDEETRHRNIWCLMLSTGSK